MQVDPRAVYRMQLQPDFGFDRAADQVRYLKALGVSHLFASPYLQAAPGSTHGYDIVDPTRVNEELGGEPAHGRFLAELSAHGLGQMLDVVPNHMAIAGRANPWWWDVLENGPSSRYATFFDVDWESSEQRLQDKILLPVLGGQYGRVLEGGEIRLDHREGEFTVRYYDHSFPLDPASLEPLLAATAAACRSDMLGFLADSCGRLPQAASTGALAVSRRQRNVTMIRELLLRLCRERPDIAAGLDAEVGRINASADALDALLERQNYRLAYWRTAGHDLGYRRFFDINDLVGLRIEDPDVFRTTHVRIIDWVASGVLQGLRVDHPDGLYDPALYFGSLSEACPQAWIVAEKILSPGESLRSDWAVQGTTGYDFLNLATGLFVDPANEAAMTRHYAEFTGEPRSFAEIAREAKRQVLAELLGSDLNRLAALFLAICERHRRHRDYTRHDLYAALLEVAACFPVYRSYVRRAAGSGQALVAPADERYVNAAIAQARAERPDLDAELLQFLRDLLLLRWPGALETELAMRFQQLSGPAAAKGIEDTAFYRYHRLVCLNEVGGDPGRFGTRPAQFHEFCSTAQQQRPASLLATSNHDTKRSGDVRARLALLSEMPAQWSSAVQLWRLLNAHRHRGVAPDANMEYLIYQTLVGTWPIGADRLVAYLRKAAREAKTHTSWLRVDANYEQGLEDFVRGMLDDPRFVEEVGRFVAPLVWPGRVNSLSQTLLKLTVPGVPHLYQGTELWNLRLVDPDNRAPVDFRLRERLLEELPQLTIEQILARADEGLPKLWLIHQALLLRRTHPQLFDDRKPYVPLPVQGSKAAYAVAYLRGESLAVVVPRLVLGLGDHWADCNLRLPLGRWHNVLTLDTFNGGPFELAQLLRRFPVALLQRRDRT